MRYYLVIDGEARGPYSGEEIVDMVRAGQVAPDTQAAPEGSDQWQPLSSVIAIPSAAPPPVPAAPAAVPAAVPAGYAPAQPYQKPKSNVGLVVGIIVGVLVLIVGIIVVLAALATPSIRKAQQRARMAEDISNMKQVKLTLDSFAMDNNGLYPAEKLHNFYLDGLPKPETSNDYFRQLFASGNAVSQRIFWVRNAGVCSEDPPEDVTYSTVESNPSLVMNKGECGLSYVLDQTNVDNPARPLLLTAFMAGTDQFDPDLYNGKTNILRIDGSARPERLNGRGRVDDGNGDDLLRGSDVWGPSGSPTIVQPAR